MHAMPAIQLLVAYAFAVLPYLCLFLARPSTGGAPRSLPIELMAGTIAATAAFCVVAPCVSVFGFDIYICVHIVLTLVGTIALALPYRRRALPQWPAASGPVMLVLAVLLGAFAARLAPILWAGHSLGGDDARFHNILAQKILTERALAATWAPFAQVPVMYPQGVHTVVAFMSDWTGRPVHEAFNVLFPVIGFLTTGAIYLIAAAVFGNRRSALWAAACYAFVPLWGSLDYYRWGGLPNAVAMLFLCYIALIVMENAHADSARRQFAVLGAALCAVAVGTTHHYTLFVAGIFLGCGILFAPDRELRRMLLIVAVISLLFCLPLFVAPRLAPAARLASSGLFKFRETPLTLLDCVMSLNPVFVAFVCLAAAGARKASWNARQLLVLAWLAGMLAAFVCLEYLYRGASLLLSRFHDCYTALTPSRLATDLAYPMSILCGFIPLAAAYEARRRATAAIFIAAAAVTVAVAFNEQRGVGRNPGQEEAALWLRDHTPPDCMVVGNFPQLEYLSWRETSNPPLPVSEPRNSPAVAWKRYNRTLEEWLTWQAIYGRSVYFLSSPADAAAQPSFLARVFTNGSIEVMATE